MCVYCDKPDEFFVGGPGVCENCGAEATRRHKTFQPRGSELLAMCYPCALSAYATVRLLHPKEWDEYQNRLGHS